MNQTILDELKQEVKKGLLEKAKTEGWSEERLKFTLEILEGLFGSFKEYGVPGIKGYIAGKISEITGKY